MNTMLKITKKSISALLILLDVEDSSPSILPASVNIRSHLEVDMGVKDYPRTIDFSESDIRKLEDLARFNGQIFEDYVANMIHSKLMPLLEKQNQEIRVNLEEWTPKDWHIFDAEMLDKDFNYSVEGSYSSYLLNRINSHTTRLLPLILSLRVLLSLSRQRNATYIPYDEFISEVYNIGLKFKLHLIKKEEGNYGFFERGMTDGLPWSAYEVELLHRGGNSRITNTPLTDRIKRSEKWFHQHYTKVKPGSRSPGILALLGLVQMKYENDQSWSRSNRELALTKIGFELASSGNNPILDGIRKGLNANEAKSTLSEKEQHILLHQIEEHCTMEMERIVAVLRILLANNHDFRGLERKTILDHIVGEEDKAFADNKSPNTLNKEFSSLMSRMVDLGLIVEVDGYVSGKAKFYSCSPMGEEFASKNRLKSGMT